MMHRKPARRQSRRGFTLIEVLLVLAILGVIMAMVVPQLLGRRRQANVDATALSIKGLEGALELYALDHEGEYPPTNMGLEVLVLPPGNDENWNGPYLKNTTEIPADAWGSPLQYEFPGQHQLGGLKPDIWSVGADRASGTADDVTNWQ